MTGRQDAASASYTGDPMDRTWYDDGRLLPRGKQ